MRKFALAALALFCSIGLVIAGEVVFVKYDGDKKELTVKDGDKEKTLKVTDKTTFKMVGKDGDMDVAAEKGTARLGKMKEKQKLEVTTDKDNATEIKFLGKKKN